VAGSLLQLTGLRVGFDSRTSSAGEAAQTVRADCFTFQEKRQDLVGRSLRFPPLYKRKRVKKGVAWKKTVKRGATP